MIAAILNAVMDTLVDHFETSVFRKLNPKFWDALNTWKYDNKILGYPVTAWHLCKSGMLICLFSVMVINLYIEDGFVWWVNFPLYGIIWVINFNFFYRALNNKN